MTDEVLTVVEANCTTGEIIERPMTTAEIEAREIASAQIRADREKMEADALAKEETRISALSKLSALGLTEEEARIIVGLN
jgi:hypothetical protein